MTLAGDGDTFGVLLRKHRRAAGWTQEELAERAGISVEAVSTLERGTRSSPRADTIERLLDALALAQTERSDMLRAARPARESSKIPASTKAAVPAPPEMRGLVGFPDEPTAFIGRDHECAEVVRRLAESRLLTLVGPGGVGKTRLAITAARNTAGSFPDGVYFIALAGLGDPRHIPPAIGEVLGVRSPANRSVDIDVIEHLEPRRALLVMDNFEHLLSGAPFIAQILEHCRTLTVPVTSRAPLRLRAEHRYVVPPMSLPRSIKDTSPDELMHCDAVALFVHRMRTLGTEREGSPEAIALLAQICTRLDGLPLAIELAAARAAILTPRVLLQRLTSRLKVLTGGPVDAPERQRTLRAAIQWSYALLPAGEQTLFARLAVFTGGCTLDSAEAVCGVESPAPVDILTGIAALADGSLLKRVDVEGLSPRFSMLATIREYACELLGETGELDAMCRRHAEHYAALAETLGARIGGPDGSMALAHLRAEADNVRAALDWSASSAGSVETGLRLASALLPYWLVLGYHTEGREWMAALLPRRGGAPPVVRARALHAAGVLAREQAEDKPASQLLEEALSLYRGAGDDRGIADVLHALSYHAIAESDYAKGVTLLEEALTRRRAMGDLAGVAETLGALSSMYGLQNDDLRAVALLEEALAVRRRLGDALGTSVALATLGMTLAGMDELERAEPCLAEALPLQESLGNRSGVALSLYALAQVARKQGTIELAATRCRQAITIWHELGYAVQLTAGLEEMAAIYSAMGKHDTGATLLGQVEAASKAMSFPLPPRYRRVHERNLQVVRSSLSDEAFQAAFQRGKGLPFGAVVELILDGLD